MSDFDHSDTDIGAPAVAAARDLSDLSDLSDLGPLGDLADHALTAQTRAYAPYSNYAVGAAVLAGGEVFAGANCENASNGASVCAERHAVAAAVFEGHRAIDAIAVASNSSPPVAPCGICRQVLREFAGGDPAKVRVLLVNPQGERSETTLEALFPASFGPEHLPDRERNA